MSPPRALQFNLIDKKELLPLGEFNETILSEERK